MQTETDIPDVLTQFDRLPNEAYVKQPVVEALFAISHSTLWRRIRSRDLPAPTKFGGRTSRWNVGQLRAVLARFTAEAA
jgi:predicted DNA-binding transcriptional regulator AlpA